MVQTVAYLMRSGRLKGKLKDETVKALLAKLSADDRRETTIEFKRK